MPSTQVKTFLNDCVTIPEFGRLWHRVGLRGRGWGRGPGAPLLPHDNAHAFAIP